MNNVVQIMVNLEFPADSIQKVISSYNDALSEWNRVNVKEATIISIYPFLQNRKEVEYNEEVEGQEEPQ